MSNPLRCKIFVLQRKGFPLTRKEVLPLYLELKSCNPSNTLAYVKETLGEYEPLNGKVEEAARGLYHAWISRLAPDGDAHQLDYDARLGICATVPRAMTLESAAQEDSFQTRRRSDSGRRGEFRATKCLSHRTTQRQSDRSYRVAQLFRKLSSSANILPFTPICMAIWSRADAPVVSKI